MSKFSNKKNSDDRLVYEIRHQTINFKQNQCTLVIIKDISEVYKVEVA